MKEYVNIDDVINRATKEAIKEYDKKKKQDQKKKVFHNTKLLLKHYNDLKIHVDKAISELSNIEEKESWSELEGIDGDEFFILSIKKSKTKTLIMLSHIDMAMHQLKIKQKKKYSLEKYIALESYYIKEKGYEEVAEQLNCSIITARRWITEMTNELSILLFGIDGLKIDTI